MSRIANNPINIPTGVDVNIAGNMVTIKGSKGELSHNIHPLIKVEQADNTLKTSTKSNSKFAKALSGTTRALIQNIVTGVSEGFESDRVGGSNIDGAPQRRLFQQEANTANDIFQRHPADILTPRSQNGSQSPSKGG